MPLVGSNDNNNSKTHVKPAKGVDFITTNVHLKGGPYAQGLKFYSPKQAGSGLSKFGPN